MATILLSKLARVELARSFLREIKNVVDDDNNKLFDYYHFAFGRTTAWADEETPEVPYDSEKYLKQFRNNILFTQPITVADSCNLITRRDWDSTGETIYDSYDDDYSTTNPAASGATTLSDATFYVMTDDFRVYKCIDNNGGVKSTDKPVHTTTDIYQSSIDGYKWKFMFQVSSSDQNKFLDASYIPVRKITIDNPYYGDINAEIDSINITSGGTGYSSIPTVVIQGDGVGAEGTAVMSADGQSVVDVNLTSLGSGYSYAFVEFIAAGHPDANKAEGTVSLGDTDNEIVLQATIEDAAIEGTIERIVIASGGRDYVVGDTFVSVVGDGQIEATATVTVAAGTGLITSITMSNVGSGYTFADIKFVNSAGVEYFTEEEDSANKASARAIISPLKGHGNNPVKEFFSTTVAVVVSLSDNDNRDLILDNDFRQIGLVKNIYNYGETAIYRTSDGPVTGTASFIVNVNDPTDYNLDDIITTDGGGEFRVIQKVTTTASPATYDIFLQPILHTITASSTLYNKTVAAADALPAINSVTEPEISTAFGEVIYIENRTSIARSEDQVETIKALINF